MLAEALTLDMDSKKTSIRRTAGPRHGNKVVGRPRTEFGTRLSHRISCEKCAKVDYVPMRVSSTQSKFCRDCAEKLLSAYEQGRHIAEPQVYRICCQCRRDFLVNESVAQKREDILCRDCFRGFDVWRGRNKIQKNSTLRVVLMRLGSRTTFRKNVDDKF